MNKFNARVCYVDGIRFPSTHEAERYLILKDKLRRHEITDLRLQVPYEIIEPQQFGKKKIRAAHYYADFVYMQGGRLVVEDAKGYKGGTAYDLFKLKKKLMLMRHGIWVNEV